MSKGGKRHRIIEYDRRDKEDIKEGRDTEEEDE